MPSYEIRGVETSDEDQLLHVARHEDSRRCLVLLDAILETPGLADRLLQVLRPTAAGARNGRQIT